MVEWGAKTIPEGGYHSLPTRRFGDGLIMAGYSAGLVEVASLKGIHYAMQSGILAARAIFQALKQDDFSAETLQAYDRAMDDSYVMADLYRTRNVRLLVVRARGKIDEERRVAIDELGEAARCERLPLAEQAAYLGRDQRDEDHHEQRDERGVVAHEGGQLLHDVVHRVFRVPKG